MNDLYLLAINLTRRCNLACAHCYMDAATRERGGGGELGTDEVRGLLGQVAGRGTDTMVVLTGGEPLLRRDLETLVAHGSGLGLSMVVGTNGVLLDDARVQGLKEAGAMGVGISLDSLDPGYHDRFRGRAGSWEKTLAGMDACRRLGLPFQVHFSVTDANADEVPAMIDFAAASGAHVLNIFFLVCTGRGESMSDIGPQRYEEVLRLLVDAQSGRRDLIIRARCAPHFKRVAYQRNPGSTLTRARGYEGGGCLAGIHYCRVTPEGAVTACPYIPDEEGSIREQPFWSIWDGSPTFSRLRNPDLGGKCGQCEFRKLCGGCRARPLALARASSIPSTADADPSTLGGRSPSSRLEAGRAVPSPSYGPSSPPDRRLDAPATMGDEKPGPGGALMDADPWCTHQPTGVPVIEPLRESVETSVAWSPEAEQRLSRVPGFLRKMIKKRAEDHVRELGEDLVTPEHMATLASRRFGGNMPPRPDTADNSKIKNQNSKSGLPWTDEARTHLEEMPGFLREGVRQVAEDVARDEGRLEVNMRLLRRLEEEDEPGRRLDWEPAAEQAMDAAFTDRPPQVVLFVRGTMEAAAEREAKRRQSTKVTAGDVHKVLATRAAGVEWDADALARVESAPEFIRGGIKRAAEWGARREGLARIGSNDLTRFRNRAMMRAVRRMRGFGMRELSFDAYEIARERVPRLQDNEQGEKRFTAIKEYVETHQAPDGSGLGTLDRDLLEKMKAELKTK